MLATNKENAMPNDRRHPHVVNIDEIQPDEQQQGGFGFRRRRLGPAAGARAMGCSHFEVAPGKTAFPYHFHSAFEEALFIIEGTGTLRIGSERVPVRSGDYVALPPGPDAAHALTNTGTTPLRYLAVSGAAITMTLDVLGYPDSKKIALAAGVDPAKGLRSGWAFKVVREATPDVGYYEDEPLASEASGK
jgi:uncharacterized cupin superfamily protein